MKVIIAGGRYFDNYNELCLYCDKVLQNKIHMEIVSGGAKGADALGEQYAKERNYRLKQFPAAWSKFGRSAGVIRNAEMANYATILIAFWDGRSRGTKSMINLAKKEGLKIYVHYYYLSENDFSCS